MGDTSVRGTALNYRADIDGLRAVAVLSVLAYHIKYSAVPGGYVGVDVFFVISGYLISSIVFREIAEGRFSVQAFYQRRIRRIFPALFGMLLFFSAMAGTFLLPGPLANYGKSMLAATTSTSNFYFWRHSSYFDTPLSQPLLHTWSLAVEEQFYIVFPLFLVVVRRFFPQRLKASVVFFFAVSLAGSVLVVRLDETTAFYMPWTRAWELLLGTMLSLGMFPRLRAAWQRNAATAAGLGMILYACAAFTDETTFPGANALWPCVGAALIIGAGEWGGSVVGTVLGWRPAAFVGLISYSLYLWHWPVIFLHSMGLLLSMGQVVPARWAGYVLPHQFDMAMEIVVSMGLAVLSWRFIEQPFRIGRLRLSGRALFAAAGAVLGVAIAFSLAVMAGNGFPGRFSPRAAELGSYLDRKGEDEAMRVGRCFISPPVSRFADYDQGLCLHREAGKKTYLMIGDSHSAALWTGLRKAMPEVNLLQANSIGCPGVVHSTGLPDCVKLVNFVFESYLPAHPVDGLLLQGRWTEKDIKAIGATVEWARAHGVPLVVIGPAPEYDAPLALLLAYEVEWNRPGLAQQHRRPDVAVMDAEMRGLAEGVWKVPYVSLYQAICPGGECEEYADRAGRVPLQYDGDHLTAAGSALVGARVAGLVR